MDIELIDPQKIKNKKILAIGAHPDDIEFGAAGTICELSKNNNITEIVVTDGGMGTHDFNANPEQMRKVRDQETRKAAAVLGIADVFFYNYPDTELASYSKNFRKRFLKYLLKARPEIIFSVDPWGRYEPLIHPDHRILAWVVVENVLFSTLPLYLKKHGFGTSTLDPKPKIWLFAPTEANLAVDVTKTLKIKLQALKEHKSQFDNIVTFELAEKRVKDRAQAAGKLVNVSFAELFRVLN